MNGKEIKIAKRVNKSDVEASTNKEYIKNTLM